MGMYVPCCNDNHKKHDKTIETTLSEVEGTNIKAEKAQDSAQIVAAPRTHKKARSEVEHRSLSEHSGKNDRSIYNMDESF